MPFYPGRQFKPTGKQGGGRRQDFHVEFSVRPKFSGDDLRGGGGCCKVIFLMLLRLLQFYSHSRTRIFVTVFAPTAFIYPTHSRRSLCFPAHRAVSSTPPGSPSLSPNGPNHQHFFQHFNTNIFFSINISPKKLSFQNVCIHNYLSKPVFFGEKHERHNLGGPRLR